jgi:hypothetical protein
VTDWSKCLHPRPYPNSIDNETYLKFASEVGWSQITRVVWTQIKETPDGMIWWPGIMIDYESQDDKYKALTKQWFPANNDGTVPLKHTLVDLLKARGVNCKFVHRAGSLD